MEFGAPDVVSTLELPQPTPDPGEVVVRVVAATVNPSDTLLRAGQYAAGMTDLTPPYVAGMEFAGYVHEVGDESSSLTVGQPVMGVVNPRRPAGGAHVEYIGVPTASVVALPDTVDLVEAATVPMNGLAAKMALDALELRAGDTLLITGAAGAVGSYAIGMAKRAGLTVIANDLESNVELLRSLGADEVAPPGEAM